MDATAAGTSGTMLRWAARRARASPGALVAGVMAAAYVACVAVLAGIGALVVPPSPTEVLDRRVATGVADGRSGLGDAISSGFSELAAPSTVAVTAAGVVIVLFALGRARLAIVVLVSLPLELAVFLTLALGFDRPRPQVEALDPTPFTGSYPSGHTAAAIALYGSLAWIVRRRAATTVVRAAAVGSAVLLPLGVGAARVYRGMHHLTDVAAGATLGVGTLAVGIACAELVERRDEEGGAPRSGGDER